MENYLPSLLGQATSNFWCYFIIFPIVYSIGFFSRLKQRNHFFIRMPLLLLLHWCIVFFLCPIISSIDFSLPWIFSFISLSLCSWLCFDHSLFDILFCTLNSYALLNSGNLLVEIINFGLNFENNSFLWYLLYVVISCMVAFLGYWFLAKRIQKNSAILMKNLWIFVIAGMLLICIAGYLNLLDGESSDPILSQLEGKGFRIFLNVIIIILLYSFRQNKSLHDEQVLLEQMIAKEQENFKNMRSYMQVIDMKCHDFRALAQMSHVPGGNEEVVSELAQSVEEYRNTPKTGNEALDVVLYDKILVSKQKDIQLTYMVDGQALSSLHSVDIATMFNNLLNNAMEYVSKLPEKEKRLISINVYAKFEFIHIRVDNYCEEPVTLIDGFPQTTKSDKDLHGFGLRSVEYVVKKNGGAMKIENGDHLFSIDIVIPIIPKEQRLK